MTTILTQRDLEEVLPLTKNKTIRARKVLKALRDTASLPLRQLETAERKVALAIV